MTRTGRQIVTAALRRIGVIASGETPTAAEFTDTLELLNELLNEWNGEQLMLPVEVSQDFVLVPNQQAYTLGDGGDFDTGATRPTELRAAKVRMVDSDRFIQAELLTRQQWQGEVKPDHAASIPISVYYEDTVPLGVVTLHPIPTTAATLKLFFEQQLVLIDNPDTEFELQEGYAAALRLGLALKAHGEFRAPDDALLAVEAAEAKAKIQRRNIDPIELDVDTVYQPLVGFDIRIDH